MSTDKYIKDNFLVVSDYNWLPDNLSESWVDRYTDNYLIYDRADRWAENDKIKKQKNVGQNIYDLFHFIHSNYDNLPEATIFCRAAIFNPKDDGSGRKSNGTCSEEFFKKVCNNKTFTELHDFGPEVHNGSSSIYGEDGSFNEINNSWYLNRDSKYYNIVDFFNDIFENPTIPNYIRFSPGGSYIIPRENMLKYNKIFYEKMMELCGHSILNTEAHMLERSLYTIFSGINNINEKYKR